jgi:hypothetical protein
MKKHSDLMTVAAYDACVVKYGADTSCWPENERDRVHAFLKTSEGSSAALVDNAFADVMGETGDATMPNHADAADFLARLQAIPEQYPHPAFAVDSDAQDQSFTIALGAWLGSLLEPKSLWSPAGFLAQGAMAAVLLVAGVFVGVQQRPDTFDDYDISATLFEENSPEYSIDG